MSSVAMAALGGEEYVLLPQDSVKSCTHLLQSTKALLALAAVSQMTQPQQPTPVQ
jgi:hypothetical protein